ncbi:MAG TPA: hypothetical protein VGK00_13160 [Anaerolineales bacterium]|jgi:hypothetical protein
MTKDDLPELSQDELKNIQLAKPDQNIRLQAAKEILRSKQGGKQKKSEGTGDPSKPPMQNPKKDSLLNRKKRAKANPEDQEKNGSIFFAEPEHGVDVKPLARGILKDRMSEAELSFVDPTPIPEPQNQTTAKFQLNRFQRFLLFGAATIWFLFAVLSAQRNYQDSWILEGVIWPFAGFVLVFIIVLWAEKDNRFVAVLCSWAVIVILLVPSLKYSQVYGQAIDGVVHYRMIEDLITTGRTTPNIYQAIAGMHSWLASMGLTSGLGAADIVKLGFPLIGGILPLLLYWICQRTQMPSDLTKYVISLSCLATYPYHSLTGTGFTLVPLILFLGALLLREYYSNSMSEKIIFTLIALIVLIQLAVWHSTTPLILLLLLASISFTPVAVWIATDRNREVRINVRFLEMCLLALILIIGYHTIEVDRVFKIVFTRLYQLIVAENHPADIVPASLFKLTLVEGIKVYMVMYGREALVLLLAGAGFFAFWRYRKRFDHLLFSYAYWSLIVIVFVVAIPLSAIGLDFKRLIWIPLAISPFFMGFFIWWWNQWWLPRSNITKWLKKIAGSVFILAAVGIFVIEFYTYQPMIPKSKSLTPETPDEYVVWVHQVNSAYQQRMITFAENNSSPAIRFDIDILGNRQYIRYYGWSKIRGLYLPLASFMGFKDNRNNQTGKLFLLHWPGKAGGFGEQVKDRSINYLKNLRDTVGWGLIYDNGESYILKMP